MPSAVNQPISRFLTIPPEIREQIYGYILHPDASRRYMHDEYTYYDYKDALVLFRLNKQIYLESRKVFRDLNIFVRILTPWPEAQHHVELEGHVPMLVDGMRARSFTWHHLNVAIDAPEVPMEEGYEQGFVVLLEDLPKFTQMWFYSSLSHAGLNPQLRLTLELRDPYALSYEEKRVAKAMQRRLILPFGQVKHLRSVVMTGDPKLYESIEKELREIQAVPHRSAEYCLREATRLKLEGNTQLGKGVYWKALQLYREAFLAMHIVIAGRKRHIHGDHFFSRELREEPYQGKNGQSERLVLRVQLVANTCQVYLKLQQYEETSFWGMRSIMMLREAMGADERHDIPPEEEAILGFPAADQMGKIYYRTALARKELGERDEARKLLRVATIYLPHDQMVQKAIGTLWCIARSRNQNFRNRRSQLQTAPNASSRERNLRTTVLACFRSLNITQTKLQTADSPLPHFHWTNLSQTRVACTAQSSRHIEHSLPSPRRNLSNLRASQDPEFEPKGSFNHTEAGAARDRAAHLTTASSQKKRKLAPFSNEPTTSLPEAFIDQQGLQAHVRSSPSSSPHPPSFTATSDSNSQAPSPASSHTTRFTTPPRVFPSHVQEEVLQAEGLASQTGVRGGASFDGAFADIHIDSGASVDMSGSENGSVTNSTEQRGSMTSPNRTLGARSASPAKRSAADMEGGSGDKSHGELRTSSHVVPESGSEPHTGGNGDIDEDMSGTTGTTKSTETQDHSATASMPGTITQSTSASSLQSTEATSHGDDYTTRKQFSTAGNQTIPTIDEQVREVYEIYTSSTIDEGTRGYVVSNRWLTRVQARSSEGLKSSEYPKESRDGEIGPVDNSDLVPDDGFNSTLLDGSGIEVFVPMRPGMAMESHFTVLPEKAWSRICEWYGTVQGQKPIMRYAHNTVDPPQLNIVYELHPPVFTVRKVPQSNREPERPSSSKSIEALKMRKEQAARGQASPDDAMKFVSSRSERFQKFLSRSKEAAGIPRTTKVKIWRLLDSAHVTVDKNDAQQPAVLSPPASRATSPNRHLQTQSAKLILPPSEFKEMEIGKHLEYVDAKDETDNDKYNGTSTMEIYALHEDQTLILEEQIGGPAGGEFSSDTKKISTKLLNKKVGSKPGSTTTSGRTSPTPGGMTTRGRARRDGRTRGTVGLTNLGNTCYMNSALQCIRSVEELAIYFLTGKYKTEINASNPLGYGGSMAKSYAGVLQGIYGDQASGAFTPSQFKKTLGQSQPLFSGYGQQDSQEFLSFLVDALHEDLNRIQKKPYNENPDSDDKTVHDPQAIIQLGETYRANHRARNDSIATDLFNGFYKNTMECPVCEKISITFDPYSLITVQLPIESTFTHNITFVPLEGVPINHALDIEKNSTIKTVKEVVAKKHSGVDASRLWMIEVYNHKIYKVFEDKHTIAEAGIQANDYIFVFELPDVPTNIPEPTKTQTYGYTPYNQRNKQIPEMDSPKAERFAVPVFSRQKNRFGSGWDHIMHPLYIMVTRDEAQDYDLLLKKVLVAVSRHTSRPILTELDQHQKDSSPEATTNGDAEKDESASEDAGRVSDTSVPSEDGYVDVSVNKPEVLEAAPTADANLTQSSPRAIPLDFMDQKYPLSPALRNQLFTMGYAESAEGMLCTGMTSINSARNMFDRITLPRRRGSIQSSTSDETTSTESNTGNVESEESDADDDEDKPDIVLGGAEDPLHLPTPTTATVDDSENDSLPDNPLTSFQNRGGRGKANKFKGNKKGRKNRLKTYGKKDRRSGRPDSRGSLHSAAAQRLPGKPGTQDDNPYYVKLGEGIVLDWYPEALDSLFNGDPNNADDMRGHWLSDADGRSLPFMPDPDLDEKKQKRLARKKHGITLEDCFAETGKREILSEDNAWYCNRCKEMRQAAKTLEIWTIPDILIVHLKRFGGNRSFRDKIDVLVDYPIEGLDMTEKVGYKAGDKEYLYDLFAVDNHYGGLGGGHYTALAKNFYDGQWYDYNDSSCSKIGDAKLRSPAAYLLFYRRRSDKPLGPEQLQNLVNDFRNPPESETTADDADEAESGEGKLGGPTSLLHGSSSALIVAGADTNASHRSTANGDGAGADKFLTQKETKMRGLASDEDNHGTQLSPHESGYGNQGSTSWDFTALDQPQADLDGTEMLLGNLNHDNESDDSMAVENDRDSTMGSDLEDGTTGMGGLSRTLSFNDSYGGATPLNDGLSPDYHDEHDLYSSARSYMGHGTDEMDTLHLEDAGATGDDAASLAAVDIHVERGHMDTSMDNDVEYIDDMA